MTHKHQKWIFSYKLVACKCPLKSRAQCLNCLACHTWHVCFWATAKFGFYNKLISSDALLSRFLILCVIAYERLSTDYTTCVLFWNRYYTRSPLEAVMIIASPRGDQHRKIKLLISTSKTGRRLGLRRVKLQKVCASERRSHR